VAGGVVETGGVVEAGGGEFVRGGFAGVGSVCGGCVEALLCAAAAAAWPELKASGRAEFCASMSIASSAGVS
jgi:hypothetical protein